MKTLRNPTAVLLGLLIPFQIGIAQQMTQDVGVVIMPAGETLLRWSAHENRTYFIQASDPNDHLGTWIWSSLIEFGYGQEISHEVGGTADMGFFRLHYTDALPPSGVTLEDWDADGDSLSNALELSLQGNPLNSDTSGDGIPDGWAYAHGLDLTADNASGLFQGGPATNLQAYQQGVQANPAATLLDLDADGLNNDLDAVPLDGEINWPKTPENRYLWIEQVMHGGAKAVSRHGHILFPKENVGISGTPDPVNVLWDSNTSSWVGLTGASSWSGSGFISGNTPDVYDAEWLHIDDMNDEGMVVGRSKRIGVTTDGPPPVVASAVMKWQMSGTATDHYSAPIYIVPGFNHLPLWDDLEKALEGEAPRIADDGTISAVGYRLLESFDAETEWLASAAQLAGHSKEMAVWGEFEWDLLNIEYRSGAVIGAAGGLLVEHRPNIPKTTLHYRNGAAAESLEGLLPITAYAITDTDIGRTPATSDSPEGRIWFSVNHAGGNAAFLEKRAGGSGVSRWHKPPSMADGAFRLNALGEAITHGTTGAIPPKLWRNGNYTDLNDVNLTSKPTSVNITKAIDLASNGIILVQAIENGVTKTGFLLPVEVAVDADRDGEITFDGKDKTTAEKPYRFWINDDVDKGDTVDGSDWEEDDHNESAKDSDDGQLNFRRDLEDLTRLWIDFSGINRVFPASDPTVELKVRIEADAGNPVVNLYQPVESDGSREYLKDENTGYNQLQGIYGQQLCQVTSAAIVIPRRAWETLPTDKVVHLLFEGATEGNGKLIFEIWKDGEKKCDLPSVHLNLKKAKDMYETWTVGDVDAAGVDFTKWPAGSATQTSGQDLPTPEKPEEKDYIMFVHGWNMPPWEKETFGSTMFKRMWHQGYKGRFGAFRWPTFHGLSTDAPKDLHTAHFDGSEQRAWNSASALKNLLIERESEFGTNKIRLYAHSMGNIVSSEALRQMAPFSHVNTYISAQAAISSHVWDKSTPRMTFNAPLELNTPNVYGYYWQSSAALPPHNWENEGRPSYMDPQYMPSGTTYINHYNPLDWALSYDNWQLNQVLKPDVDYNYGWPALDFIDISSRFWKTQSIPPFRNLIFPNDRFEVFSYAAQSHGYAAGQQGATGGKFNVAFSVNLRGEYGFESAHKGHSAQFRSTIQKRWTYWRRALRDMDINLPPP